MTGALTPDGVLDEMCVRLDPIVFYLANDSAGGGSRGDGGATQPAPADWSGADFVSDTTAYDIGAARRIT